MSSITQDESNSWLNIDLIKNILANFEGHNQFEVHDFNVNFGASEGENFAGVIKRISVNYTSNDIKKSKKFILKSSPSAGAISELLEDLGVFEREVYTYETIHRSFEDLLPGFKTAPKYYYDTR